MNKRISKEQYYLNIAKEVSKRSTCLRRTIGAVIIRDDQIVSTGYVGAPRKTMDCQERGFCMRNKINIPPGQQYELCRSVHAEQNAIINTARAGVSLYGSDMYIWGSNYKEEKPIDAFPCFICKKMIINAEIKRVICSKKNGGMHVLNVKNWIKEWSRDDIDIIDDKQQYGAL